MSADFRLPKALTAASFATIDDLVAHLIGQARGPVELLPQDLPQGGAGVAVFTRDAATGGDVWLGWAMGDAADPSALRAAMNRAAPTPQNIQNRTAA